MGADLLGELVPSGRQCEEPLACFLRCCFDGHILGFFGVHSISGRAVLLTLLVICHELSPSLRSPPRRRILMTYKRDLKTKNPLVEGKPHARPMKSGRYLVVAIIAATVIL